LISWDRFRDGVRIDRAFRSEHKVRGCHQTEWLDVEGKQKPRLREDLSATCPKTASNADLRTWKQSVDGH
jgi:hypothetical protein